MAREGDPAPESERVAAIQGKTEGTQNAPLCSPLKNYGRGPLQHSSSSAASKAASTTKTWQGTQAVQRAGCCMRGASASHAFFPPSSEPPFAAPTTVAGREAEAPANDVTTAAAEPTNPRALVLPCNDGAAARVKSSRRSALAPWRASLSLGPPLCRRFRSP